jgi:hypothetical protein
MTNKTRLLNIYLIDTPIYTHEYAMVVCLSIQHKAAAIGWSRG